MANYLPMWNDFASATNYSCRIARSEPQACLRPPRITAAAPASSNQRNDELTRYLLLGSISLRAIEQTAYQMFASGHHRIDHFLGATHQFVRVIVSPMCSRASGASIHLPVRPRSNAAVDEMAP